MHLETILGLGPGGSRPSRFQDASACHGARGRWSREPFQALDAVCFAPHRLKRMASPEPSRPTACQLLVSLDSKSSAKMTGSAHYRVLREPRSCSQPPRCCRWVGSAHLVMAGCLTFQRWARSPSCPCRHRQRHTAPRTSPRRTGWPSRHRTPPGDDSRSGRRSSRQERTLTHVKRDPVGWSAWCGLEDVNLRE